MYSVISFNGNDKKFNLGKHKIFAKGLSQDEAIKIKNKLNDELELNVIKNMLEIAEHDKVCKCGKHDSLKNNIKKIQNSIFYYHQKGNPIYVLMLKPINSLSQIDPEGIKGVKVIENENFMIVDYCFNKEELNNLYQKYEKFESIFILHIIFLGK